MNMSKKSIILCQVTIKKLMLDLILLSKINRLVAYLFFPIVSVIPLLAQTPNWVEIYSNQVYYLEFDRNLFSGMTIKATNPNHEYTVAKPSLFSPNLQEDFFADSPEAMAELEIVKRLSSYAAFYTGATIAFITGMVFLEDNYVTDLLSWAGLGTSYFGVKQASKAENHFRRALRARNLYGLINQ